MTAKDAEGKKPRKKLLIVDENEALRAAIRRSFERDLEVFEAESEKQALEVYERERPDAVILEPEYEGALSWNFLQEIRVRDKTVIIILLTLADISSEDPHLKLADGTFRKPCGPEPLKNLLIRKGLLNMQSP